MPARASVAVASFQVRGYAAILDCMEAESMTPMMPRRSDPFRIYLYGGSLRSPASVGRTSRIGAHRGTRNSASMHHVGDDNAKTETTLWTLWIQGRHVDGKVARTRTSKKSCESGQERGD